MDDFFNIRSLKSTLKDFQFQGESPVRLTKNYHISSEVGLTPIFLALGKLKRKSTLSSRPALSQKNKPGTMAHTYDPITEYSGSLNRRFHKFRASLGLESEPLSQKKKSNKASQLIQKYFT